ncbi:MAG: hypothetical protein HC777_02845 [Hyphomonadaceae bacterium]|nr:hypothetical protein [Hyphomonadaceae bacterium]
MSEPYDGQARLHIDLEALAANYRFFAAQSGSAKCSGVVKANGYGLGIHSVTQTLAQAGCETFFVAHLGEGHGCAANFGWGWHHLCAQWLDDGPKCCVSHT